MNASLHQGSRSDARMLMARVGGPCRVQCLEGRAVLERAGTMTVKSSLAAKRKRATVRQDGANITLRSSIKNETASRPAVKRVLVVGIGGTSVKILQDRALLSTGVACYPWVIAFCRNNVKRIRT